MKITHIGHACILVEILGLKILSDPWWRGPCFGAQWWLYPEPYLDALEGLSLDYIYISHGHEDHFHPGTLKSLKSSARILVAKDSSLPRYIRELGFQIIEIDKHGAHPLGNGVECRIVPTYGGDTFITLTDGEETLVNLNDSLHPLPAYLRRRFIKRIKNYHPCIDYVFCGYGVASHFPNCYFIPGKDYEASAQRRQLFFNRSWADIINQLEPRYGFPFAADVVLLEDDLFWSNEPLHNAERPTEIFRRLYPGAKTTVLDIACGFTIADGEVQSRKLTQPLRSAELRNAYHERIARANRHSSVSEEDVEQLREMLESNIERHFAYLKSFKGDYAILVRLRNSNLALHITKHGRAIRVRRVSEPDVSPRGYDLIYTTRLPYLRRSLARQYGQETLFVGSGGVFEYLDASRVHDDIHDELMIMISKVRISPSRRLKRLKRLAKQLLSSEELDLYNLARWTVFKETDGIQDERGRNTF